MPSSTAQSNSHGSRICIGPAPTTPPSTVATSVPRPPDVLVVGKGLHDASYAYRNRAHKGHAGTALSDDQYASFNAAHILAFLSLADQLALRGTTIVFRTPLHSAIQVDG